MSAGSQKLPPPKNSQEPNSQGPNKLTGTQMSAGSQKLPPPNKLTGTKLTGTTQTHRDADVSRFTETTTTKQTHRDADISRFTETNTTTQTHRDADVSRFTETEALLARLDNRDPSRDLCCLAFIGYNKAKRKDLIHISSHGFQATSLYALCPEPTLHHGFACMVGCYTARPVTELVFPFPCQQWLHQFNSLPTLFTLARYFKLYFTWDCTQN